MEEVQAGLVTASRQAFFPFDLEPLPLTMLVFIYNHGFRVPDSFEHHHVCGLGGEGALRQSGVSQAFQSCILYLLIV